MNDDLNTPAAIAALYDMTHEVNTWLNSEAPLSAGSLRAISDLYGRLAGDVLGLMTESLEQDIAAGMTSDLLDLLVDTRAKLREEKQYALADRIRDRLAELGVVLRDTAEGTRWIIQ